MMAAAVAAVAKRAGLQASRGWSVLSVDGCYFEVISEMIGDWRHCITIINNWIRPGL